MLKVGEMTRSKHQKGLPPKVVHVRFDTSEQMKELSADLFAMANENEPTQSYRDLTVKALILMVQTWKAKKNVKSGPAIYRKPSAEDVLFQLAETLAQYKKD